MDDNSDFGLDQRTITWTFQLLAPLSDVAFYTMPNEVSNNWGSMLRVDMATNQLWLSSVFGGTGQCSGTTGLRRGDLPSADSEPGVGESSVHVGYGAHVRPDLDAGNEPDHDGDAHGCFNGVECHPVQNCACVWLCPISNALFRPRRYGGREWGERCVRVGESAQFRSPGVASFGCYPLHPWGFDYG